MSTWAKLRTCASCEWIFRSHSACPKCGFGSYGARYVYGDKCYRYEKTQQPWLDRKVNDYAVKLLQEIEKEKHEKTRTIMLCRSAYKE